MLSCRRGLPLVSYQLPFPKNDIKKGKPKNKSSRQNQKEPSPSRLPWVLSPSFSAFSRSKPTKTSPASGRERVEHASNASRLHPAGADAEELVGRGAQEASGANWKIHRRTVTVNMFCVLHTRNSTVHSYSYFIVLYV